MLVEIALSRFHDKPIIGNGDHEYWYTDENVEL